MGRRMSYFRRITHSDILLRERDSVVRSAERGWFDIADPDVVFRWARRLARLARKLRRRGEI